MRWDLDRKQPKIGDRRTVMRFAFFPTKCVCINLDEGVKEIMVWLEYYYEDQQYTKPVKEKYMPDWITLERYV